MTSHNFASAEAICPSSSPTLRYGREVWMCTRDGGHEGEHQARDSAGVLLAGWPQTDADPSTASAGAETTEAERMTAIVQAADHLSFMVTSYLLGDLDAATVQRALEAYSAARKQEVPF